MYDKEKTTDIFGWHVPTYMVNNVGSWIIMGLATLGILSIINFFIQVNKFG